MESKLVWVVSETGEVAENGPVVYAAAMGVGIWVGGAGNESRIRSVSSTAGLGGAFRMLLALRAIKETLE